MVFSNHKSEKIINYENETVYSWVHDGGGCVRLFGGLGEGR
jgi:hypothetical protein